MLVREVGVSQLGRYVLLLVREVYVSTLYLNLLLAKI